jgi:hypothetical protein
MKKYLKTNKENTEVKIELKYNLGGLNYWNYKTEARGYWLHIQPLKIERQQDCTIESYDCFSGYKALILETKRKSDKAYNTALEMLEAKKTEMLEIILTNNNLNLI